MILESKKVPVKGKELDFFKINLGRAPLLVLVAPRGFVMCGYLDIEACQKLQDTACRVKGVKGWEDFLEANIESLTSSARELGIEIGMKVKEALPLLI